MPESAWEEYKKDVLDFYPEQPVNCDERKDWCYFETPCTDLLKQMPDLKFSFKTNDGDSVTYNVPPKSFLYAETRKNICHLGIAQQRNVD